MKRNSSCKLMLTAVLAALIAAAAPAESSGESLPPGAAVDGYLALGDLGTNELLSIYTDPIGGEMLLLKNVPATHDDSIVITTDVAWTLTVEDKNALTSNYDGKMRKGSFSGETWNYNDPQIALTNGFAVLVVNIGSNGYDGDNFNNLEDATDLSSPVIIVTDDSTESSPKTVALRYSQQAVSGDGEGRYRIELTYTLSGNS